MAKELTPANRAIVGAMLREYFDSLLKEREQQKTDAAQKEGDSDQLKLTTKSTRKKKAK